MNIRLVNPQLSPAFSAVADRLHGTLTTACFSLRLCTASNPGLALTFKSNQRVITGQSTVL